MLRAKKFMNLKRQPIYKFLREIYISNQDNILERIDSINFYTYYFNLSFNLLFECLKQHIFNYDTNDKTETYSYIIKKDIVTDTIFLTCDKIIIFYINKDDIEEFCLCYMYSSLYKFAIYEYYRGYMAICLSHNVNDIDTDDLLRFYLLNNSNPRYIILSHFLYKETYDEAKETDETEETKEADDEPDDEAEETEEADDEAEEVKYNLDNMYNSLMGLNDYEIGEGIEDIGDIGDIGDIEGIGGIDISCKPTGFIILNKNVQSYLDDDRLFDVDLYVLYDKIGYGEEKPALSYFIKTVFKYVKCYNTYPVNYWCV